MTIELYPVQKDIVNAAVTGLKSNGVGAIKAGQRSGKSMMTFGVLNQVGHEYDTIIYLDPCYLEANSANSNARSFTFMEMARQTGYEQKKQVWRFNEPHISHKTYGAKCLLIIDEAMWVTDSFELYSKFKELNPDAHVLVVSSNGPEYGNGWWTILHNVRGYSTSEANPYWTIDSLRERFEQDPQRSVRDYLAY